MGASITTWGVSETKLVIQIQGSRLTIVDGSLVGGGLLASVFSTLAALAEVEKVDFETASVDFW